VLDIIHEMSPQAPPLIDTEDDNQVGESCSVSHFRTRLETETRRLTELCDNWEKKMVENKEIISDVTEGELRCVIGQGRLVMVQRFNQFSGLVDNCEFKQGEKETTCMDLKGFWEMIYFQVEDVDKKFANLTKLEKENWVVEEKPIDDLTVRTKKSSSVGGVARKRAAVVTKKVATSGLKALIAAKRRKASGLVDKQGEYGADEVSKEVDTINIIIDKASDESSCLISPEKTFDGGFFSVKSPARQVNMSPRTSQSTGCDKLRKSVLTESAKRVSGLVSPFVSQMARRAMVNEKLSPVGDSRRSSLFDDDFEQENEVEEGVSAI